MSDSLDQLCKKLEIKFRDISLLRVALTHSSLANSSYSNERMEFVGDRVLGLIMAELLYKRFPSESEGALAKRHAQLVRMETLAEISRDLNVGSFLRMANGEANTGGRDKDSLLADAMEAIVAAIYFDQGLESVKILIDRLWSPYFSNPIAAVKDYKTLLQEKIQANGHKAPTYEILSRAGPAHAPDFTVQAIADTIDSATGQGKSKRKAEQAAAKALLEKIEHKI